MSRIANNPVSIPRGVGFRQEGVVVTMKGPKGELSHKVHPLVRIALQDGVLSFSPVDSSRDANAQAGTARSIIGSMVAGVAAGFEKRLQLVGVGYRAQAQGKNLNLSLGFSHPVDFPVPDGVSITAPSPTEIVIQGADKQQVGQVAANIRAYRPPEPYKGKGIKYADEVIVRKEAKKK